MSRPRNVYTDELYANMQAQADKGLSAEQAFNALNLTDKTTLATFRTRASQARIRWRGKRGPRIAPNLPAQDILANADMLVDVRVRLPRAIRSRLVSESARRLKSIDRLAAMLIICIVRDELIDAVLDGEDDDSVSTNDSNPKAD